MSLLNHGSSIPMNPNIQQLRNVYNMIRQAQNPQMLLNNLASQNPQLAQAMQMCKSGNPKDIFYKMCEQRGINPEDILNQLK